MGIIILAFILLFSICFHEYAHGWVADRLGDHTPRSSGRLTLNPLAHIDPFGTIMLPAFMFLISNMSGHPFIIGYAKPVPINPYNFKNPKKQLLWVGLSGPVSNLIIAFVLSIIAKLSMPAALSQILFLGVTINVILGIFNLIPIPPLDGSRVLTALLPHKLAHRYLKLEPYGFVIIILLVMSGVFGMIVFPVVRLILTLLGIESFL